MLHLIKKDLPESIGDHFPWLIRLEQVTFQRASFMRGIKVMVITAMVSIHSDLL
jgi:hypothetical protein